MKHEDATAERKGNGQCHVKSLAGKFYPGNYLHPYTSVILKS